MVSSKRAPSSFAGCVFDVYLPTVADPTSVKTFFEMTDPDSGSVFLSGDSSDEEDDAF